METNYKSISCAIDNGRTIYAYLDEPSVSECLGVTKALTFDNKIVTYFEHKYGSDVVYDYNNMYEHIDLLGKYGDKWDSVKPLSRLISAVISKNDGDYDMIFDTLDQCFDIDKTKAEDTIWLEFDPNVAGENHARLDIRSDFYTLGGWLFFDYTRPLSHFKQSFNNPHCEYSMKDIVNCLCAYQTWLNKPLKVVCSFNYTSGIDDGDSAEEVDYHIKRTLMIENLYAGTIEDYINKGLNFDWQTQQTLREDGHKLKELKAKYRSPRVPDEIFNKFITL